MNGFSNTIAVPAGSLLANLGLVAEKPGLYFVFFRNGIELLTRTDYFALSSDVPLRTDAGHLLYIGATTQGLRTRIKQHLKGDGRVSSLRRTVGVMLADELQLRVHLGRMNFHFGEGEERLTRWLCDNTLISVHPTKNPMGAEKFLIGTLSTPLNITARRTHPYAKHLMNLKALCKKRAREENRSDETCPSPPRRSLMRVRRRRVVAPTCSKSQSFIRREMSFENSK